MLHCGLRSAIVAVELGGLGYSGAADTHRTITKLATITESEMSEIPRSRECITKSSEFRE